MNKLINVIPNSSFEEFEYSVNVDRPNTIKIKDWNVTSEAQIHGLYAYSGAYSMILKNSAITMKFGKYNPQHLYYLRAYCKTTTSQNVVSTLKQYSSTFFTETTQLTDSNWSAINHYIKPINPSAGIYNNCTISFHKTSSKTEDVLIDSIMLLDLTEAFGAGYEPSYEWCNDNIPYFEKEYDIEVLPKEIEFTCKEQFVYDDDTKKYYSNDYNPLITFVIKNVDKNYNTSDLPDILDKIKLVYTIYNKSDSMTLIETLTIDDLTFNMIGNDCYVSYHDFNFKKSRHHVKLEIYSDLCSGTRVKDELTIYFVGKYDNFECNLDYDLSYASTYLRKLSGTTNAYTDVPMNIDVFINGIKTSPVNILNQDDKLTSFEKDLYLGDGNNVIEVVVTDICGNTKSKKTEIYVDCMTPEPEKEDLLKNFIGNDDSKIRLDIGDAKLKYKTSSAGLEKDIVIDTSVGTHYFKLLGENANLYRLSKDNIPKIKGDIIRRPLGVVFDSVEKIYDGNTDITGEVKKLKLDNGYYLTDVHKEYNDYANTGLVRSVTERRVTSETIANANEYIATSYTLSNENIDIASVYINIDGVEGYSYVDESNTSTASFALHDNSLNHIFKSIDLIVNDATTTLQFTYVDDVKINYKVINRVDIKYNYSNKYDVNQITYKTSDVGKIAIDFKNAFFKSKDVIDTYQPITCIDIQFIKDTLGDASGNYQLANYAINGRILRRTIHPHITCLNKVYDGSPIVPIKIDDNSDYYNGFENAIRGDDIYIDTTFEGDKDSETHIFTKHGSTIFVANDSDVGENKIVTLNSIFLEGHDAKNYTIGEVISNYKTTISKRPISIVVNKLRLIRATRRWEMEYSIINDIKEDNLTVVYNTGDNLDIKVYGGIDNNGDSIHTDYKKYVDIIPMFFNYPYTNSYKFENLDTEVKKLSEDGTTAYWRNEARPAEPDTERIDIDSEIDIKYPGEVKHTLSTLSNGVQTSYFESKDKNYKIYSGCKVMVTNINLNPLNNKLKNYNVLNSSYETEIEII